MNSTEAMWEDEMWWRDLMEELASMSIDALVEVVCNDDVKVEEIRQMCNESDKNKEDVLNAIRELEEEDMEMFAEEIENQWEDAWEFIQGENAVSSLVYPAVAVTLSVFALNF